MTELDIDSDTFLTSDQMVRCSALYTANQMIPEASALGSSGTARTMNLLRVARWIVEGDLPEPFTGAA